MAWEQLVNVKLSSNGTLTTGTFTAKKFLWVQLYCQNESADSLSLKFNDSTSTDYKNIRCRNGSVLAARVDKEAVFIETGLNNTDWWLFDIYIINDASKQKIVVSNGTSDGGSSGAGSAPNRTEVTGVWADTSNQITKIDIEDDAGTFNNLASGSEITVYGTD